MQTTCLGRRRGLWSWFKQVSSWSYPAGPVSQDKIAVQVLLLGDLIYYRAYTNVQDDFLLMLDIPGQSLP